jgi:hypothetical protein
MEGYNGQPQQQEQRGLIGQVSDEMQKELDTMMDVLEEIQGQIPEGAYLRGMNALGALHKHKRTALAARRPGDILRCWQTLDEILEEDEDLYDEIMEVADDIVMELCGEEATIYADSNHNLVHRGEEKEIFDMLVNYKPEEGNAGYETSPMVLHHAIQVIMARIFDDTHHELEIVRPVSCQCGWRGAQGNWDRHITNARHQRWVNAERERTSQKRLAEARETIVARRDSGIVYLNEMHCTPETQIVTAEAIREAEAAGDRVIFMCADGTMSWFC